MQITDVEQSIKYVGAVDVETGEGGAIALNMPQRHYKKSGEKSVLEDGWGPFCEFVIDTGEYRDTGGVYVFTVHGDIKYVGQTKDIHKRIQQEYGHISPANCFQGGQGTNCRVNTAVFHARRRGKDVSLWVSTSGNRNQLENELINMCDPPWNKQIPDTSAQGSGDSPNHQLPVGKYEPLYNRLNQTDSDTIRFAFNDINQLLDSSLPSSAYSYREWWNPAGHSHAEGWESHGWTVASLDLDREIVEFKRG